MSDPINAARQIIEDRIARHGENPFQQYVAKEMSRIDLRLMQGSKPDRQFHQSLTHGIGLMRAREMAAIDPPFCGAVYGMLEQIRLQAW